jgi:hypothetical protein
MGTSDHASLVSDIRLDQSLDQPTERFRFDTATDVLKREILEDGLYKINDRIRDRASFSIAGGLVSP